jgi:Protein of unknown function (DUF1326)
MRCASGVAALFVSALVSAIVFASSPKAIPSASTVAAHWQIIGDMSEACTCSVPCGCNFSSHPSHHYCWSIASFDIQKGHYGKVSLNGLHLVRGHGKESIVWYIDERATPGQASALAAIARHISGGVHSWLPLHFERARIVQVVGKSLSEVEVGEAGGFKADYLIGGDGKHPIVVENMTAWNVSHDIKGRTERLHYKDRFGNHFDLANTSSNEGKFDWTDTTARYF